MCHSSMDGRLMKKKYFYRIPFLRSIENRWQCLYGHQLREGATFLSLSFDLYEQACLTDTPIPPQHTNTHSKQMLKWIYEVCSFFSAVLIKELYMPLCQNPTRHFRQSGTAASDLKVIGDEGNGKENTLGWKLVDSGSAQHDNI